MPGDTTEPKKNVQIQQTMMSPLLCALTNTLAFTDQKVPATQKMQPAPTLAPTLEILNTLKRDASSLVDLAVQVQYDYDALIDSVAKEDITDADRAILLCYKEHRKELRTIQDVPLVDEKCGIARRRKLSPSEALAGSVGTPKELIFGVTYIGSILLSICGLMTLLLMPPNNVI